MQHAEGVDTPLALLLLLCCNVQQRVKRQEALGLCRRTQPRRGSHLSELALVVLQAVGDDGRHLVHRRPRAAAAAAAAAGAYTLRLYVAGQTARSTAALANLRRICDEHLADRYTIEVIDLLEHPQLAAGDQILAVPTLVRHLPTPIKRIIGTLSDTDRVLVGLDLRPAG